MTSDESCPVVSCPVVSCPVVEFPIAWENYCRLPRHAGYRYEYSDGEARLTPRPRQYHCLLPLQTRNAATIAETPQARVNIRPMRESDWLPLEAVFAKAFRRTVVPEQAVLEETEWEETDDDTLSDALSRARGGQSGPLVRRACFVATAARPGETAELVGGLLITLLPAGDLERFDDPAWAEQPPTDAVEQGWGRPHLTWVFVDPPIARYGVASLMLDHAVNVLHDLGYQELASTFLLGNDTSTLWHWRNGFRLVSYVGSPRIANQESAVESIDRCLE